MLVVLVQLTVRRALLGEFERAVLANADGARTREPGCVRFDVSQREDDPSQWLLYEVYRDAGAFEAHRPLRTSPPTSWWPTRRCCRRRSPATRPGTEADGA
ncbi:MAG: putative quinol monooxygenase [Vicinamibacterales bacterium]